MPWLISSCLAALVLVLTACGGGGGGGGSNPVEVGGEDIVLTGQFIDSPVSGIRYVTATRSGITDSNGQFEYLEGETVSLYIGDQLLGDAPGAATISLFDLVDGIDPLVGNALKTTISKLNEFRSRDDSGKRKPNFSTVINLAILLQTLDQDGNPDNGIEIPEGIAALFAANSVNFNQHWDDFTHEHGFRKVLAEAKSQSLLDSARQVRKSWDAMAHLYASLGIDSKVRANNVSTTDNYGRGTPDFIHRYTFDNEGLLIRDENDADGTANSVESYIYDANGNQTRFDYDYNADGTSDSFRQYTYDVDGNLTRMETGGDNITRPSRDIYSYDAYGNETRIERYNALGLTSISTRAYDANGRQTRSDYDDIADDSNDISATWTYQSNGYQVRRESGEFGQANVITFSYDTDDNLLRAEYDHGSDGTLDRIYTYTNDAQGNEIRLDADYDGNGTTDASDTKSYDAYGNVIREASDYDNDGTPDRVTTHSFDASGNLTRYEDDQDGDGIPEELTNTAYDYDTDGNWLRYESDEDGDGMADSSGMTTYDANGNPIRRTYDADLNGTPDRILTWDYAANTDGWWWLFNRLLP